MNLPFIIANARYLFLKFVYAFTKRVFMIESRWFSKQDALWKIASCLNKTPRWMVLNVFIDIILMNPCEVVSGPHCPLARLNPRSSLAQLPALPLILFPAKEIVSCMLGNELMHSEHTLLITLNVNASNYLIVICKLSHIEFQLTENNRTTFWKIKLNWSEIKKFPCAKIDIKTLRYLFMEHHYQSDIPC